MSSITDKIYFKNNRCEKLLSEFTTISDEALAILIYENNATTWKDMVDKNITKKSEVTKKYTNSGSSNCITASTRQYQGWSSNGMKRFNELFDLVKADRRSVDAVLFEESFHDFCSNGGIIGKKRRLNNLCLNKYLYVTN